MLSEDLDPCFWRSKIRRNVRLAESLGRPVDPSPETLDGLTLNISREIRNV